LSGSNQERQYQRIFGTRFNPAKNRANAMIHFAIGLFGSLFIFLVFTWLSGVQRFSMPTVVVFVGINCALLAHFISPWATPAVLVLYALVSAHEFQQDRAATRLDK
jgi:hypothetical protein